MSNVYCKWCGHISSKVSTLTMSSCSRNPTGKKHELYEGSEKSEYTCKCCGHKSSKISTLTMGSCSKSSTKKHQPAL